MAEMRESMFMPTIKCSQCGSQVEISMMGDHKCNSTPVPQLSPSISEENLDNGPRSKFGASRGVPPNLDTNASNQPFLSRGQLTPVSNSSDSRSLSPHTPDGRSRTSNEFYEPGIASEDPVPSPRGRPGGYGGFDNTGGDNQYHQPLPSPSKPTGLMERMNTIVPGPFEVRRRQGSTLSDSLERPGTSHSNISNGNGSSSRPQAPQKPRKNGYGGFGPPDPSPSQMNFPQDDFAPRPIGDTGRAETFPRAAVGQGSNGPNNSMNSSQAPSAPPMVGHNRTPSMPGKSSNPLRDTSRPPPPRNGNLIRPRTSGRDAPQIDLAQEFGTNNPYHSSHNSVSSVTSSAYPGSPSLSNPPGRSSGAPLPRRPERPPTDMDMNVMNNVQQSMQNMSMDRPPSNRMSPLQPPQQQKMVPPPRPQRAPSNGDSMPAFLQQPRPPVRQSSRDDYFNQQARQEGPNRGSRDELMTPQPQTRPRQPSRDDYMSSQNNRINNDRSPMAREPSATPSPPRNSTNSNSPRSTSSRGNCKACTLPITGKSISSADGRLTGRYHKSCFTCTTCQAPFTSGEFYVYSDRPYCERHYHQLNGSLCGSCRRGIEGQYLEDEKQVKYHVNCFRCADCSRPLSDGYFEVEGRVYCERDALRRTAPLPQNWNAGDRNMQRPPSRNQQGPNDNGRRPPIGMRGPGPRGPGMGMSPLGPNGQMSMGGRGGPGGPGQFVGLPRGQKIPPSQSGLAPSRPRMNKRMTRLGMM